MHLVVQGQRVIALAPVVADALRAVHDQRIDVQLIQARGDRKPGLPAANDQHDGIPVDIRGGRFPEVKPIGAAKVARIGFAFRPRCADLFLEPFDFVERCEQCPRFHAAIGGIGHKPQDAVAAAFGGFESEDRFDRVGAGAHHMAGRSPAGIGPEASRTRPADMRVQLFNNSVGAVNRSQVPGQRQRIAPMAIRMKQGLEQDVVGFPKSPFELGKPIVCNRRDGVCSSGHSCLQTFYLTRVLALHNLRLPVH